MTERRAGKLILNNEIHRALRRRVAGMDGEPMAAEVIARRLVDNAMQGDVASTSIILDRTEGKVPQTSVHATANSMAELLDYVHGVGRTIQGPDAANDIVDAEVVEVGEVQADMPPVVPDIRPRVGRKRLRKAGTSGLPGADD